MPGERVGVGSSLQQTGVAQESVRELRREILRLQPHKASYEFIPNRPAGVPDDFGHLKANSVSIMYPEVTITFGITKEGAQAGRRLPLDTITVREMGSDMEYVLGSKELEFQTAKSFEGSSQEVWDNKDRRYFILAPSKEPRKEQVDPERVDHLKRLIGDARESNSARVLMTNHWPVTYMNLENV